MTTALIITALILVNGFFVMAEFALIGVPRASIERLAAQGNPAARKVRAILHSTREQDRYIATAQVGITIASLGLGMFGEHALAEWFSARLTFLGEGGWIASHTLASLLALTILTYLHIVVGEMVAKSIALQKAERAVLWITPPLYWIERGLYPLVALLNLAGNAILRLMGVRRQIAVGHYHTPEELQHIVRESQEMGLLGVEAGQVVRELFEFGELTAHEVMVPRVRIRGVPLGSSPERIRTLMRDSGFTRFPVYQGDLDHIVGMVHIKDLMRLVLQNAPLTPGVVRPVPFVPETSGLDTVLAVMRRENTQIVVVMDEFGGTAGVATIEDLFEEVVGDIEEGGDGQPDIFRDRTGRLHVLGTVRLDELGESMDVELEHEEVDTVSGLVLALLERPARVGDIVTYGPVRFQITAVDGRGVRECLAFQVAGKGREEGPPPP